jgi:hypothetical protein
VGHSRVAAAKAALVDRGDRLWFGSTVRPDLKRAHPRIVSGLAAETLGKAAPAVNISGPAKVKLDVVPPVPRRA